MKTSLVHLPQEKQKEIEAILEVIKEFKPSKVILFGSYATGKWQQGNYEKNSTLYEFNSDYDILVVINGKNDEITDIYDRVRNRCASRAPINVLVHSIDYINTGLAKGQYFFSEIIRTGILLYDTGESAFTEAKELTSSEKKAIAEEYYNYWYELSSEFLDIAENSYKKAVSNGGRLNMAAYQLFQAVEGFYSTVLLVCTNYKPKTHNLDTYRNHVKGISADLDNVFPINPKDRYTADLFSLLKQAYIGAKYKMDFPITEKQLSDLINYVNRLKEVTSEICKVKISSY